MAERGESRVAILLCVLASAILFWVIDATLSHLPVPQKPVELRKTDPDLIQPGEQLAAPEPGAPGAELEVIGTGPANPVRVGERVAVGFWLKNSGSAPVWVVRSLDGSCFGRYPRCVLEIRDESGTPEFPRPPKGCGITSPLKETDFLLLGAQQVLPEGLDSLLGWWKPSRPGLYSIRLTYDTTGTFLQSWAGSPPTLAPRLRELLRRVPKGRFPSKAIQVTVVD